MSRLDTTARDYIVQISLPTAEVTSYGNLSASDIYIAINDPGNNIDQSDATFNTTGWTLLRADQYLNISPGHASITNTDSYISLDGAEARFLALRLDSNHGSIVNGGDVGVSEIQIYAGNIADNDRLPSDWETFFGLAPYDDGSIDPLQGADGDPDGDGASNEDELIANTNPNDSSSVLMINNITAVLSLFNIKPLAHVTIPCWQTPTY